jgi:mono/diheme cytochrome c family protein
MTQRLISGCAVALLLTLLAPLGGCDKPSVPASAKPSTGAPGATVEEGRYLATAGNCISCHTRADGEPFAGGVAFYTPFGTLYSSNITPDDRAGIGHWSEQQFRDALQRGLRDDGAHLYPAFPYTAYTKLSDAQVAAIFAYLRTIPASTYVPLDNDLHFPFNWRPLLGVWNALNFEAGRYVDDPTHDAEWNRGAFLVTGLTHCSACHSPRNLLGAEKTAQRFAGGTYTDPHPDGEPRTWSTVNLTPAAGGLGAWSVDDWVDYLTKGAMHRAGVFGPMNEVLVNSTEKLSTADVHAMAVYFKSLPPLESQASAAADAARLAKAAVLYDNHCGLCHQSDGQGSAKTAPPLDRSAVVQAPDPASLINVVLFGPVVPDPAPHSTWNNPMPSFNDELSDEEVADIASYVRNSWHNRGSPVAARQIEAQR